MMRVHVQPNPENWAGQCKCNSHIFELLHCVCVTRINRFYQNHHHHHHHGKQGYVTQNERINYLNTLSLQ